MTVKTVDSTIRRVSRDARVDRTEAKKIIDAATTTKTGKKDAVSVAEGRRIAEFYEKSNPEAHQGHPPPLASPQTPQMTAAARREFNNFFVASRIPAGDNEATMRGMVETAMARVDWGDTKLDAAPRLAGLYQMKLPYPEGLMDAPMKSAYVDPKKDQFYVHVYGGMPRPGGHQTSNWYGPIPLHGAAPTDADRTLTARSVTQLRATFAKFNDSGALKWTADSPPFSRSQLLHEKELLRERHPDGFTYTAVLHVGMFSDRNSALDPDQVNQFWVKREGGLAGTTMWAGPFSKEEGDNGVSSRTLGKVLQKFERIQEGSPRWGNSIPLGVRLETQPLSSQPGADGYRYDALFPTGALSPTAPRRDPDNADYVYIRRSGGITGQVKYLRVDM